jgi:hypothetical protein
MTRIGRQIVRESKAAIAASTAEKENFCPAKKTESQSRDLLSLLIRANMDTAVPENQRLTDEDVVARTYPYAPSRGIVFHGLFLEVPTFLVAGHETTR